MRVIAVGKESGAPVEENVGPISTTVVKDRLVGVSGIDFGNATGEWRRTTAGHCRPVRLTLCSDLRGDGLRSGTLNVPGIVGLARAASLVIQEGTTVAGSMLHLREKLRHRLTTSLDGVKVNGSLEYRLPGNLNVSFAGVDAEELLARLPDVALSGGSACSSGQAAPSHVLTAMGCSRPRARGAVRISIGRFNTEPDIRLASERIIAAVRQLRDAALAGV
jgi:cysteine desulfurase